MQAFLILFWGLIMSAERRWLGGGLWKVSRIWKNIAYVGMMSLMYLTSGRMPKNWMQLLAMIWVIAWMIRFWNHTHGDYFDLTSEKPDEERSWWVGKVLKQIFGKGKYYNFAGNFIGLTLGYLVPAILASILIPNHMFWVAGFAMPLSYVACGVWLGKLSSSEYAEWVGGFLTGVIFYLNLI